MAEAGPSSPTRNARTSTDTGLSSSPPHSRRARIHFPLEDSSSSLLDAHANDIRALGLGQPPLGRRTTLSAQAGKAPISFPQDDARRRVKSTTASATLDGTVRSNKIGDSSVGRRPKRRSIGIGNGIQGSLFSDGSAGDSQSLGFSDEYDLSREDPRILEDVQRAVKLKARREARIRANPQILTKSDGSSSFSAQSTSPAHAPMHILDAGIQDHRYLESEIDFSPSVGVVPLHPVPTSHDGGVTLDWSGSASDDEKGERRWTRPLQKLKGKDKSTGSASRGYVEKQDSIYADKLSLIKAKAKNHTLRKASMTADQLARHYHMLSSPPSHHTPSFHLLDVARWMDTQDPAIRASYEKTEPFTWLKHLWEKHPRKIPPSPRYLTARMMEEFSRSHTTPQPMETILEDEVASTTLASFPDRRSPSVGSSLEPSISRVRPDDTALSFEPVIESSRNSTRADSRLSSDGLARRHWRHSYNGSDSARSSISGHAQGNMSPTHHRHNLRDLARRVRQKLHGSEEALSSAKESSGQSTSEEGGGRASSPLVLSGRRTPLLQPASETEAGQKSFSPFELTIEPSDTAKADDARSNGASVEPTATQEEFPHRGRDTASRLTRNMSQLRHRLSLPPSGLDILLQHQKRQQEELDEEREGREYDRKTQLLKEADEHNRRTWLLLKRVGASIKDYDSIQSNLSMILGASYPTIPPDVLDAIAHDPSVITGPTKSSSGWQAVEEIHDRVLSQRRILKSFRPAVHQRSLATLANVFSDPITSLQESLRRLENYQEDILRQMERAAEMLQGVKVVHGQVKTEYNDTLGHTSLVYPELSQIVALEENYRNQYQQLWDFGLDALTLLLDTVTPFWRNYGKVIGEDMQDFLIVPWYRNEFTGEPKRYPITHFPKRSFRHWVGLMFFSFLTCCTLLLQFRAAVTLTVNSHLPWITRSGLWYLVLPFYIIGLIIQWCAVLVECSIVFAQGGVVVWWMGWTVNIFT